MKNILFPLTFFSVLVGALALPTANAATQYWDVNGTTAGFGGAGTWSSAIGTLNWNDSTGTSSPTFWTNGNDAIFQGTAGTVTLAASPNIPMAASLSFKTNGYIVTGQTLDVGDFNGDTIQNDSMTINVDGALTPTSPLTNPSINSLITAASGETVTYNGNTTGTLTIAGNNTNFNGNFILSSGNLVPGSVGAFGGTGNATAKLSINGGKILSNGNRNMTVLNVDINSSFAYTTSNTTTNPITDFLGNTSGGEGTAVITLTTSNPTITVENVGNGSLVFSGKVGEAAPGYGFTKAGPGRLTLQNPANSYTGPTTITDGQLRVDVNGTVGSGTGTIYLSGGKLGVILPGRSAPIANPIVITADSSIITVNSTATVAMNLSGTLGGSAGILTFKNEGPAASALFDPHLTNSSNFTFTRPMVIDAGLSNNKINLGFYSASGTQTFSGVISSVGASSNNSITRSSDGGTAGTTVLSGANTYTGATKVLAGTLVLGDNSLATGAVTVGGGAIAAKLGGNAKIGGATTLLANGTIGPGNSIGRMDYLNNLTLSDGTWEWEFSGGQPPAYNAPIGADIANVAGILTITTAATLSAAPAMNLGTYVYTGDKFIVFNYATAGGSLQFNGLVDDTIVTIGGKQWVINYNDTNFALAKNISESGGFANALTLTAIPEASSLLTVGLGGIFAIGAVWLGKRLGFATFSV